MGDIRVDYGRLGYRYKETRKVYSCNTGETIGGDGRVGYRYHNRNYSYHNPGNHSRLLSITKFEGGDIRG